MSIKKFGIPRFVIASPPKADQKSLPSSLFQREGSFSFFPPLKKGDEGGFNRFSAFSLYYRIPCTRVTITALFFFPEKIPSLGRLTATISSFPFSPSTSCS